MISYIKKTDAKPAAEPTVDNRFAQIRKTATEQHKKTDLDRSKTSDPA